MYFSCKLADIGEFREEMRKISELNYGDNLDLTAGMRKRKPLNGPSKIHWKPSITILYQKHFGWIQSLTLVFEEILYLPFLFSSNPKQKQ